jgi:hypothetical protein
VEAAISLKRLTGMLAVFGIAANAALFEWVRTLRTGQLTPES